MPLATDPAIGLRPVRVVTVRTIATGVFIGMWAFAISAAVVGYVIAYALAKALERQLGL